MSGNRNNPIQSLQSVLEMPLKVRSDHDRHAKNVIYFRLILLLGGIIYPLWTIPFVLFAPGITEDPVSRIILGLFSLALLALSFVNRQAREQIESLSFSTGILFTSHFFFLLYRNNVHPGYAIGAFITIGAVFVTLNRPLFLKIYSALVIFAATAVLLYAEKTFVSQLFYVGILTNVLVAYVSQIGRLQIIEKLRETEENLSEAQSIARLGSWGIDLVTKQIYWSEELPKLLGINPNSSTSLLVKYLEALSPEDRDTSIQELNETICHGTPYKSDRKIITATGEEKCLTVWCNPLKNKEGAVVAIKAVFLDITEAKKAEKFIANAQIQMLQSSKMASLGEMAGGVAHEINNPLAILTLILETMDSLLTTECEQSTELKGLLNNAQKTIDRIAKIVRGLRTFSRDASADPFEKVNVKNLITETLAFCLERYKHDGVQISIEPIPHNLTIDGRSAELSQVLLNLFNNAHDAVLTLKDKWIKIWVTEHRDQIEINIMDSGPGIPKHIASKLFQPFFTTKPVGKGTGLGLSVSFGIVKSYKGNLRINPSEQNTSFVISLPKVQTQSTQIQHASKSP